MQYRRRYTHGATYFLTVNLENRQSDLLIRHVDILRNAFKTVKNKHPFDIDAVVILPDHFHIVMTLPPNDANYSTRIKLIKYYFSLNVQKTDEEYISKSRLSKSERGIWQRRFWEHQIRDETDYFHHVNYVHINPLKHGLVNRVQDWQYSSFHHYVKNGIFDINWAG